MPQTRDAATTATRNLALMTFAAKGTLIPLTSSMNLGPTVIVRSVRLIGQLGWDYGGGAMLEDLTLATSGGGRARERCAQGMRATHLLLTSHHITLAHSFQHTVAYHSSPPQTALDEVLHRTFIASKSTTRSFTQSLPGRGGGMNEAMTLFQCVLSLLLQHQAGLPPSLL